MSGVRANWHVGDLELPDADPLQQISELKSDAIVIDLSQPDEIEADLQASLAKEGRYEAKCDLSCDLKWEAGHRLMGGKENSCHTCPEFTDDQDDARMLICRLGRRQEGLLEALEAARAYDGLEREFIAAVERDLGACEELAEASLAAV